MKKTDLKGILTVIGCCIHIVIALGFSCAYISAYALIPDTYGIGFDVLGTYTSLVSVSGVIGCLVANTFIKKLTLKGAIFFGIGDILVYSLLVCFVPGSIGFAAAMFIGGFITAFSGYYLTTAIISNWFAEKSASMLGITFAAGSFGLSAYFSVAGIAFNAFGVRKGFLVLGIASAALLLINAFTLLRKTAPDNQEAPAVAAEEASAETVPTAAEEKPKTNIYKSPVFWLFMLNSLLCCGVISAVQTYSTVLFTNGGIEYTLATNLLSILGIVSGIFVLISGKAKEKMGLKPYIFLVFAFALVCNILAILYTQNPTTALAIGIVGTYAIGYAACLITTYVIYEVCRDENTFNVNTKSGAALLLGNVFLMPIFGKIVESGNGLGMVYTVSAAVCVLSVVIYMICLGLVKKKGKV